MWWVRLKLVAVEARKAEDVNCTEFLIPSPPDLTGSKALVQAVSSRLMLVVSLTIDLRVSSYPFRLGERKLGEDRMVKSSLGMANELWRRRRVFWVERY